MVAPGDANANPIFIYFFYWHMNETLSELLANKINHEQATTLYKHTTKI